MSDVRCDGEKKKKVLWGMKHGSTVPAMQGRMKKGGECRRLLGALFFFFYILDSKVEGETAMFKRTNGG